MDASDTEPINDQTPETLNPEEVLPFKVCVAAIWSDGAMAAAERDHLSHLMDRVSASAHCTMSAAARC